MSVIIFLNFTFSLPHVTKLKELPLGGAKLKIVKALTNEDQERVFYNDLPFKYKIIWLIGRTTGLRVSDILLLRPSQVVGVLLSTHHSFSIKEKKTGKCRTCDFKSLDSEELASLKIYLIGIMSLRQEYLFCGRDLKKPLSRIQVYRVLSAVAKRNGLEGIGTHSMRKTFAREHYKLHRDVSELQCVLNHKNAETTMGYLIDKNAIDTIIF